MGARPSQRLVWLVGARAHRQPGRRSPSRTRRRRVHVGVDARGRADAHRALPGASRRAPLPHRPRTPGGRRSAGIRAEGGARLGLDPRADLPPALRGAAPHHRGRAGCRHLSRVRAPVPGARCPATLLLQRARAVPPLQARAAAAAVRARHRARGQHGDRDQGPEDAGDDPPRPERGLHLRALGWSLGGQRPDRLRGRPPGAQARHGPLPHRGQGQDGRAHAGARGEAAHPRPAREGRAVPAPLARRGRQADPACLDLRQLRRHPRGAPHPGPRQDRAREADPGRDPDVPEPQARGRAVAASRPVHPRGPAPRARDRREVGHGVAQRRQARRPAAGAEARDHAAHARAGAPAHRVRRRRPSSGAVRHRARHRACARASCSACAGRTSTSTPVGCGSATRSPTSRAS